MKWLGLCVVLFAGSTIQAQLVSGGMMPEIAISHRFHPAWSATIKMQSQLGLYDNQNPEPDRWTYDFRRFDLQGFIAYRMNPFWSLSGGYQARFDGENPQRSIQQLAFIQKFTRLRLGHRLRTDQTYLKNEPVAWRVRYRLSTEIALQGESVDDGEFYLIFSEELISNHQYERPWDLENRVTSSLGYYVGSKAKMEAGFDLRTGRIIVSGIRNRIWMRWGCFLNF